MVPRGASRNKGPAASAPSQAEKSGRHGGGAGPEGESRPRERRPRPKPGSGRTFSTGTPLSPLSASPPRSPASPSASAEPLAREAPLGFTQPTQQSLGGARTHTHEGKGIKRLSAAAPGPRACRGRRSPARELPAKTTPPPSSALSEPACQGGPLYLAAGPQGTSGSVVSSS